jgi:hypothetical protein
MEQKWAIMVCLDPLEDDWIYVTKQQDACAWPTPILFESIERAFEYADAWRLPGKEKNVQVVAYDEQ